MNVKTAFAGVLLAGVAAATIAPTTTAGTYVTATFSEKGSSIVYPFADGVEPSEEVWCPGDVQDRPEARPGSAVLAAGLRALLHPRRQLVRP